jgi:hypothetical protein
MKPRTLHDKIAHRVALATLRPCPSIVPSLVAVRLSDGFEFSPGGSIPWPSRIEKRGFVYYDERNGTTYGKRFETERAARLCWQYRQLRNAVEFLRVLRLMNASQLRSQAGYWLGVNENGTLKTANA